MTIMFVLAVLLAICLIWFQFIKKNDINELETFIHDARFLKNLHFRQAEVERMIRNEYLNFSISDTVRGEQLFSWYLQQKPNTSIFSDDSNEDVLNRQITEELFIDLINNGLLSNKSTIIDIAAGYGRSIKTLAKFSNDIDVVEPIPQFVENLNLLKKDEENHLTNIFPVVFQNFTFHKKYDVIYICGLLDAFSDIEVVQGLIKIRDALNPDGKIFLSENILSKTKKPYYIWAYQKIRQFKAYSLLFSLVGLRPVRILNDPSPADKINKFVYAILELDDY